MGMLLVSDPSLKYNKIKVLHVTSKFKIDSSLVPRVKYFIILVIQHSFIHSTFEEKKSEIQKRLQIWLKVILKQDYNESKHNLVIVSIHLGKCQRHRMMCSNSFYAL